MIDLEMVEESIVVKDVGRLDSLQWAVWHTKMLESKFMSRANEVLIAAKAFF